MKFILLFAVILFFFRGNEANQSWYDSCNRLVTCGSFLPVGFPFWGGVYRPKECGYPHLKISCSDRITPTLMIEGMKYVVLYVNELDRVIRVTRYDYYVHGVCLKTIVNTTLDWNELRYAPTTQNLTVLYGCEQPQSRVWGRFSCKINGIASDIGYYVDGIVNPVDYHCNQSVVVASLVDPEIGLNRVFLNGFQLNYTLLNADDVVFCEICEGAPSNGSCGYDNSRNRTVCVCPYGSEDIKCKSNSTALPPIQAIPPTPGENSKHHHKLNLMIIGLCVGGGLVIAIAVVLITVFLGNRHSKQDRASSTEASSYPLQQLQLVSPRPSPRPSPNSILEEAGSLAVRLFSYSDLKKATHNFDDNRKLGSGAFGTVYYGKLPNGQELAVKRFSHHNDKILEQYMNEVRVLSHLQHKNLLVLFGFTSRKSTEILLAYEYLSDRTVWDHLHDKFSQIKLPWPLRLKIAVETAEGLLFLHQNQVIHRDVKTTNILLDDNFQVKVADFGLAKFFPQQASHVSTIPQGTPGYVDPEYFQNYRLTEKSDVYGLGVVLMELISGKEAVDPARPSLDINLFNMALDRIRKGEMDVFVDSSLPYDVDPTIKTSVDSVAELGF